MPMINASGRLVLTNTESKQVILLTLLIWCAIFLPPMFVPNAQFIWNYRSATLSVNSTVVHEQVCNFCSDIGGCIEAKCYQGWVYLQHDQKVICNEFTVASSANGTDVARLISHDYPLNFTTPGWYKKSDPGICLLTHKQLLDNVFVFAVVAILSIFPLFLFSLLWCMSYRRCRYIRARQRDPQNAEFAYSEI